MFTIIRFTIIPLLSLLLLYGAIPLELASSQIPRMPIPCTGVPRLPTGYNCKVSLMNSTYFNAFCAKLENRSQGVYVIDETLSSAELNYTCVNGNWENLFERNFKYEKYAGGAREYNRKIVYTIAKGTFTLNRIVREMRARKEGGIEAGELSHFTAEETFNIVGDDNYLGVTGGIHIRRNLSNANAFNTLRRVAKPGTGLQNPPMETYIESSARSFAISTRADETSARIFCTAQEANSVEGIYECYMKKGVLDSGVQTARTTEKISESTGSIPQWKQEIRVERNTQTSPSTLCKRVTVTNPSALIYSFPWPQSEQPYIVNETLPFSMPDCK